MLRMLGDRRKDGPQRAFATANCYEKMAHHRAENPRKPPLLKAVAVTVNCYGICPVACFDEGRNSTIVIQSP
jgi:hypothetical protein